MGKWIKRGLFGFIIIVTIMLILGWIVQENMINKGNMNHFEKLVEENKITEVIVLENVRKLNYQTKDQMYEMSMLHNYFELNPSILEELKSNDVKIGVGKGVDVGRLFMDWFMLSFFILIAFYLVVMLVGFSRSKVEFIKDEKMRFDDVGGLDNVKDELKTLVAYLKEPEKLKGYVDKIPKGILFEGDPGNGKTLLARVLAGESKTPFFYISGADIEGSFVAQGSSRVGNILKQVKKAAKAYGKAILFIDELDSIGMKREKRTVAETNQTLNKLLTELDGFKPNENILVIGATNLVESLDKALVRSGRFDRVIKIPMPNYNDRKKIIELYIEKRRDKVDENVFKVNYIDILAKQTSGFSGADLSRLVNDALLLAYEDKSNLKVSHLRESYLRIVMGLPNNETMDEEEEKIIAYHEAAHAIVTMALSKYGARSISYGTIKPYGKAGGHVSVIDNNKNLYKKTDFYDMIKFLLAGRAIEDKMLDGNYTNGASNDLMKVNQLIHKYIIEFGMSPENENLYIDPNMGDINVPWLQEEVKNIREKLYKETREIVDDNIVNIEKLANYLLEHKEIDHDEILDLFEEDYPVRGLKVGM